MFTLLAPIYERTLERPDINLPPKDIFLRFFLPPVISTGADVPFDHPARATQYLTLWPLIYSKQYLLSTQLNPSKKILKFTREC